MDIFNQHEHWQKSCMISIFFLPVVFLNLSEAHPPSRMAFGNFSKRRNRKSDDIYVTFDDIEYILYVYFDVHAKD